MDDEKLRRRQKERSKKKKRRRSSSDSNSPESDKWVEKKIEKKSSGSSNHDEWMSMGGMIKTFTKDDIKPNREIKDKKQIDSYNPSTSSRELNPYWKNGGTGVPQTSDQFRRSNPFIRPERDDDYYSKSSSKSDPKHKRLSHDSSGRHDNRRKNDTHEKSYNWKKNDGYSMEYERAVYKETVDKIKIESFKQNENVKNTVFLSDEKMNKLAAKIVKAEIMGDTKLVAELKAKLDAAKAFRKQNPDYDKIQKMSEKEQPRLLIQMNPSGSSQPVMDYNEKINKGGRIKTYSSNNRINYYANDEKYDISRMFQQEKYGSNHKNDVQLVTAARLCKDSDTLEDLFVDRISQNKRAIKETELEEKYAVKQNLKLERSEDCCNYCFDSKNMLKHLVISCGSKVYLSIPGRKSLVEGQCVISTIHHYPCVTSVDEDVWEEIMFYRKMVTHLFNSQNKDVVFFESAINLFRFPHMRINCIPLPRDVGDTAPIYFKKALLECETEWTVNKKVVELKGKNIRKGIPKGLPYFWVDFGMEPGFAHVVEDQHHFPETFAQQIIGGMLDLDHRLWKKPQQEFGEVQRKKVVDFLKQWKPIEEIYKNEDKKVAIN